MLRFVQIVSVSCVVCMVTGCGPRVDDHRATNPQAQMIAHITEAHGIRIATNADADVIIKAESNTVSVVFTSNLVSRLPQDCLPVLHFTGPEKVLTEEGLERFLNDFHEYLLLTYGEGGGPRRGKSP